MKRALAHADLVLKQMRRWEKAGPDVDLRPNIRLLGRQIAQAYSQIERIRQAYENNNLLYTPEEGASA